MDKYNVQYNNYNTIAITFFLPTSSLSIANSFFPMPLPSLSLTCLFTPHCHHSFPLHCHHSFPFLLIVNSFFFLLLSSLSLESLLPLHCHHSFSFLFIDITLFLSSSLPTVSFLLSLSSLFSTHHCQHSFFSFQLTPSFSSSITSSVSPPFFLILYLVLRSS